MTPTMTLKMYTAAELARELGIEPEAVRIGIKRGTYTPQATTADGRHLFAEDYVTMLKEQRKK